MLIPEAIARHLRNRKRPGAPRRVFLFRQRFFLEEECVRAFKRLGLTVQEFLVEDHWQGEAISRFLTGALEFLPDFFFSINHIGFDREGWLTHFLESCRRPAVTWYVDHPDFIIQDCYGNVSDWVQVLVWDRYYLNSLKDLGFANVRYLPLAADSRLFRPYARPPAHKFASLPAAFVGSTWQGRLTQQLARFQGQADKQAAIAAAARLFLTSPHYRAREDLALVYPGFADLPRRDQIDLEAAATWQASCWDRLAKIIPLTRCGLKVFGEPAWQDFLPDPGAYGGLLHYHRELPAFYQCVAVNLNVTSLQMKNGLNQRVFDVPAAGAFLLTDARETLSEIYGPEDVATYQDLEEARGKLTYFAARPDLRRAYVQRARERVLAEHTYLHRGREILTRLHEQFC